MLVSIIVYLVINILLACILLAFYKRVTTPFGIFALLIVGILTVPLVYFYVPLLSLLPIIFIIGFIVFKFRYPWLDFSKKIFSLKFIHLPKNNKNGRIIGKCFPYYPGQLKHNFKYIVQDDTAMKGGTILTGSSGSGKTYGIINSIKQDIIQGKSVAFFDFKGDLSTIDEIAKSCKGIKTYKLNWDECNFTYDPLINLDENGKVEAILNMRKWSLDGSDEHYKTSTQLLLQKTINEYKHDSNNYLFGYYNFLQKYNVQREMYDAYNTIIKLLELTISSNIGHIFNGDNEEFTFRNNNEQYALLVSFSSASKTLGTSITSLMLNDLMEVGTKSAYSPSLCLYIDEFGSCQSPLIVKDILEKGRSCGIATTLSMQDLNQLIINTNAPFMDSILGTVNSFIIYSGATRQTAEKLAGTQIYEIDDLLMTLKKPINGKPPTAMYISKYPIFEKGGTEVYRFIPISDVKSKLSDIKELNNTSKDNDNNTNNNKMEEYNNNTNNNSNNIDNNEQLNDIPSFEQNLQEKSKINQNNNEEPVIINPINLDDFL